MLFIMVHSGIVDDVGVTLFHDCPPSLVICIKPSSDPVHITPGSKRDSVTVPFHPLEGSPIGELSARFDMVVGWTPADG